MSGINPCHPYQMSTKGDTLGPVVDDDMPTYPDQEKTSQNITPIIIPILETLKSQNPISVNDFVCRIIYLKNKLIKEKVITTYMEWEKMNCKVEKKLANILPDVSRDNSIRGAIGHLLNIEITEVRANKDGMSVNGVYLTEKNAVKVFPAGDGRFINEVLGLIRLGKLNLKEINVPKICAIGRCLVDNVSYLIFAEDLAPGQLLRNIIQKLNKLSLDSIERKNHIDCLVKIYQKLGTGLAAIHNAGKSIPEKMHSVLSDRYTKYVKYSVQHMNDHLKYDTIKQAQSAYNTLLKNRGEKPYVLMHRDAQNGK